MEFTKAYDLFLLDEVNPPTWGEKREVEGTLQTENNYMIDLFIKETEKLFSPTFK